MVNDHLVACFRHAEVQRATAASDGDDARRPRAWQRMLSGRRLDLLDPSPLDIEIEDIAHGLARVARWNGQTDGAHAFSVAQHCAPGRGDRRRICEPDLDRRWRLAALLHDAPEYVIGDMISPFKAAIGVDYKAFEARLLAAIHLRFGLPAETAAALKRLTKRADRQRRLPRGDPPCRASPSAEARPLLRPRGAAAAGARGAPRTVAYRPLGGALPGAGGGAAERVKATRQPH